MAESNHLPLAPEGVTRAGRSGRARRYSFLLGGLGLFALAALVVLVVISGGQGPRRGGARTKQADAPATPAAGMVVLRADGDAPATPAAGMVVLRADGGVAAQERGRWREVLPGEVLGQALVRVGSHGLAQFQADFGQAVLSQGARIEVRRGQGDRAPLALESGRARLELAAVAEDAPVLDLPGGQLFASTGAVLEAAVVAGGTAVRALQGMVRLRPSGAAAEVKLPAGRAELLSPRQAPRPLVETEAKQAFLAPSAARTVPPRRGAGALLAKDRQGQLQPLELRRLHVRTYLENGVALTEIDTTFFNPTDLRTEGTYYFDLPEKAAVCRFAMYVSPEKLMEGEILERSRAQQIYQDIVRRMQDPALLEWQSGNTFKTRIFPLEPKSEKRLLLAYTEYLPADYGQRRYSFPLVSELTRQAPIGEFSFQAKVRSRNGVAGINLPAYPEAEIANADDGGEVTLTRRAFSPQRDLLLLLTEAKTPPVSLFAHQEKGQGKEGYFLVSINPASLLGDEFLSETPEKKPRDLLFLYDSSLSRSGLEGVTQRRVLELFLAELDPADRFGLVRFDADAEALSDGFVAGQDAANAALAKLDAASFLGGTDLVGAFAAARRFLEEYRSPDRGQTIVLLTDGIPSLGVLEVPEVLQTGREMLRATGARLFAVTVGHRYEGVLLRALAREGSGLFLHLDTGSDLDRAVFAAALALHEPHLSGLSYHAAGPGVGDLYPQALPGARVGEEIILLGRYGANGALGGNLSFELFHEGKPLGTFQLPLSETNEDNYFVPRLWARARLDHLLAQRQNQATESEIVALAQEFTLMTPYTSFMVFESEQQMRQYGVERHKRRRYWQESRFHGGDPAKRLAREAAAGQAGAPPAPAPQPQEQRRVPPPQSPPPPPKPLQLRDLDLDSLQFAAGGDRVIATALANLCLQVYYRYLPLYGVEPKHLSALQVSPPLPPPPPSERVLRHAPRPLRKDPYSTVSRDVPALRPAVTRLEAEPGDHFETDGLVTTSVSRTGGSVFGYRIGGGRRMALRSGGGSAASESAVDSSKCWLARFQRHDGSWGAPTNRTEATSLSLLAFLSAGHTEKTGAYKKEVKAAVNWLVSHQDPQGRISAAPREQALATLALSEAAAMTRIPRTMRAAQRAFDHLVTLQRIRDGKRYGWGTGAEIGDMDTTAWAVLALKSTKIFGLRIDDRSFFESVEGALRFLDAVEVKEKPKDPLFAHRYRALPRSLAPDVYSTAQGITCRIALGYRKDELLGGLRWMMAQKLPDWSRADFYYWCFGTLACFQTGGEFWRTWNECLRDMLVEHQVMTDGALYGSWPPVGVWRDAAYTSAVTPQDRQHWREALEKALAACPKHPTAKEPVEDLMLALASIRHEEDLLTYLAKAPINSLPGQLLRLRRGRLLLEKGQYLRAAEVLADVRTETGAEDALAGEVDALWQLSDREAALLRASRLARAAPDRELPVRLLLGLARDPAAQAGQLEDFLAREFPLDEKKYRLVWRRAADALYEDQEFARATALYERLFQENPQDEPVLGLYVEGLRQSKRAPEALVVLARVAHSTPPLSRTAAAIYAHTLFSGEVPLPDAVGRVEQDFPGGPAKHQEAYFLLAAEAARKNNWNAAARLYLSLYTACGRPQAVAQPLHQALVENKQPDAAAKVLVEDLKLDSREGWRFDALARLLVPKAGDYPLGKPADFIARHFVERPRLERPLVRKVARVAYEKKDWGLSADFHRRVWEEEERPEDVAYPYAHSLVQAGRNDEAEKLVRWVLGTGHGDAAFATLWRELAEKRGASWAELYRAATCAVELHPDEAAPRQEFAQWLEKQGKKRQELIERLAVAKRSPTDPVPIAAAAKAAQELNELSIAERLLLNLLETTWESRYGDVETPALRQLRELLQDYERAGRQDDAQRLRERLARLAVKDLVCVMTWDTRDTDVDLHVIEPGGGECSYQQRSTPHGGVLDRDVTDGLGPETYTMKRARPGEYLIEVVYYSGEAKTRVRIQVTRNLKNSPEQKIEEFEVLLTRPGERQRVTTIKIEGAETGR